MENLLPALKAAGWKCVEVPSPLPITIRARYSWLPSTLITWLERFDVCANPSDTAWFTAGSSFHPTENGFRWDEWEQLSLVAAKDDNDWQRDIQAFWDVHFPFMNSVKNGYAFLALRKSDGAIVLGNGPEFEEVRAIASSLDDWSSDFAAFLEERTSRNLAFAPFV
jgi:hypothetical protein